jgi:uncharacterized protein (TIGR00290 family)
MLLSGFDVPVLLVIRPTDRHSTLYHSPGIEISHLYEGLTGIRTEIVDAPLKGEGGHLTQTLKDLKAKYDLDAICSGALLSDHQRMNFTHSASDAGLISYTPLWRKDGTRYMNELMEQGYSYMLISYSSAGFSPRLLGTAVDEAMLNDLFGISKRWGSHPAFEGGEAETLILSAPLFPKKLQVKGSVKVEGENNASFMIEEAELI